MKMKNNNSGSVLVLVLVVASGTAMVLSSLSDLALTERRFNDSARLIIEAKEAAEASVEVGFSQLTDRFDNRTSFPTNALSPSSGNPLVLTDEFYNLFQNGSGMMRSRVRLPAHPYDPTVAWGAQETEVIGGQITPGEWTFIDGSIPGNQFDPLRDKLVFIREVQVYGKATVENDFGDFSYTAHVGQVLQVRDAPLFAHAIFYNMDMEIAPGPAMDIRGSVHANGNMFIQANNSLDFYKNVSAIGRIYHGPNPIISKSRSYGTVTFSDGFGNQVRMYDGSSWIDSRLSDFGSISSNRWNGNLQGYEHGIRQHNPVAIDPYVRDNPDTAALDDPLNYAYQLIQPLENNSDPDFDPEIEKQKFVHKAGLVITVDTSTGTATAHVHVPDGDDGIVYDASGEAATLPLTLDPGILTVEDYLQDAGTDDVLTGLYDQRMREEINLVEIDVSRLKEVIENNNESEWGGNVWQKPSVWWNGVVYVQLPQKADPDRPDNVRPAVDGWGVKLKNGGSIPNPSFGHAKDLYGMTVATNAPMYVQGNYNADGDSSTGTSTEPDVSDPTAEPPAALVADAITILSNSWDDKDSVKGSSSRKTSAFTEVSAAILTGLVPSDKSGWDNYSGGVENFPRFLEVWNTTLRYRGSMVALFESEVATEPWGKSNVYGAPGRDWGFNSLFSQGFYPPGTPNTRQYDRVNYRSMSKAEYDAALANLATYLNP
jgi:hypothetical protein